MLKINSFNYIKYYKGKNLLNLENPKTIKGEKDGYLTGVLYLAPFKRAGKNMCSHATLGCIDGCLNTSGHGQFDRTQNARILKTNYFLKYREEFLQQLYRNINSLIKKADKMGLIPIVRLNGTSDLTWENVRFFYNGKHKTILQAFKHIQFYDYSKYPLNKRNYDKLPDNYDLTFSLAETNENRLESLRALNNGIRVAVVYDHNKPLPKYQYFTYNNRTYKFPVINGDSNDLRFNDPSGVVIGLIAKGKAKNSNTGFVLYNNHITIN